MSKLNQKTVSVKQVRSLAGSRGIHRKSVKGLGLRKINHIVEVVDTPANRGMINKVRHIVEVIEK
jgi:large subunit ribosomal protein L30|tara:strand:- start:879 stop:1073 length:195 start_codon:yes stop_codon:yes gene_type:complete